MARVVQQRSTGAPYLLITLVFLFLMASAAAGIFYNSNSKLKKDKDEAVAQRDEAANTDDRSNDTYKRLREEAKGENTTVVALQDRWIKQLVKTIAESEMASADTAIEKAKTEWENYVATMKARDNKLIAKWKAKGSPATTYDERGRDITEGKRPTPASGDQNAAARPEETLLAVIRGLGVRLAAADKELEKIDNLLVQREADKAALAKDLATAQAKYGEDVAAETAKVTAKQDELDKRNTEYEASVKRIEGIKDQELKGKNEELDRLDKEIVALKATIRGKNELIAQQKVQIEGYKKAGGDTKGEGTAPVTADAKILRAVPAEGVVYIDIGSADRVRRGLPFAIFDNRKGVDLAGEGKAKIVVTSVRETTSECRIIQASSDNPIIAGDLVSNLAFDASIPPLFVVEGPFDLDGDGRIEARGEERIKAMITRYGGRLAEQVAPNTDYVVMGEPPSLPEAEPAAGAPPVQRAIWEQKVSQFKHYEQVKSLATSMQKPILSVRQFLALIGYVPDQGD